MVHKYEGQLIGALAPHIFAIGAGACTFLLDVFEGVADAHLKTYIGHEV